MGKNYVENSLKRFLKRKVKITMGVVVSFLITGMVSFGAADKTVEITFKDGEITINQEIGTLDKDNNTWTTDDIINVQDGNGIQITGENEKFNIINKGAISGEVSGEFSGETSGQLSGNGIVNKAGTIGAITNTGIISGEASGEVSGKYAGQFSGNGIVNKTGTIGVITNTGIISGETSGETLGTYAGEASGNGIVNNPGISGKIEKIENSGLILGKSSLESSGNGIYNFLTIDKLLNTGIISGEGLNRCSGNGIYGGKPMSLLNKGVISGKNDSGLCSGSGILTMSSNEKEVLVENDGIISGSNKSGDESGTGFFNGGIIDLSNKGVISGNDIKGKKSGNGIFNIFKIDELKNIGLISGNSEDEEKSGNGISNYYESYTRDEIINKIANDGTILGKGSGEDSGNGIYNSANSQYSDKIGKIENITNRGLISGNSNGIYNDTIKNINGEINNITNYGIIAGSNKAIEGVDENKITNYGLLISGDKIVAGVGGIPEGKEIINGVDNATAKAITSTELADKNKNLIINVVGKEGTAFNINSELILSDSIINGYKNAVTLTGKDFTGNNVIVNAGENAFTGSDKGDKLTLSGESVINGKINLGNGGSNIELKDSTHLNGDLVAGTGKDIIKFSGESIINGKVDLGAGEDKLAIDNTVQINKDLDGGADSDTLTFNSSSADNMNLLHNISNFENINVDSNITLFENVDITGAKDIVIGKDGNLTLRVDSTDNNSHALSSNNGGTIKSEGGKLLFVLNGLKEGAIIELGNTLDSSMKGNEIGYSEDITLDTTSLLHDIKKRNDTSVIVETVENLPIVNPNPPVEKPDYELDDGLLYEKLNEIYQSIREADEVGEFNVTNNEELCSFLKYLHDIFAENPYAYSSELSRKTMSMMKNLADRDLKPDYKEWAIYGGFTHVDGGTKDTFYGRGYYTYDVGSHTDHADTKINGGYFKAEYGKAKDLTTGIIFGGNNSETEIGASKVEGDSFYFGTYVKKYLNNFRFTLGAGFQHGDYKGDRTALGYGVTETRKYSENYHDRGFNIYGNTKYIKELGNNFFFEPSLTLEYSYVDQDGVKEDGVLAIETDSRTFDYLSGTVNLDLRKNITSDTLTHSFISGISYERMLSGYDSEYITGRIIGREKLGKDFDILVPEKEKDTLSLNLRYELETEKGLMFDVKGSYRFEHDNNDDEWIIGTGIGYKF